MPSIAPRPASRAITWPQILAVLAIWTGVIYGLAHREGPEAEQISLKVKPALTACAPQG
ncbi:hypothetical protein [Caulobacter vibrioides]|uniref:hypothetical protein n=1 Tax=Caulobacter vibrioides TaxID=155892 RepID=UPI0015E76627|nr:hypothetical protein [Caulobacter vibrioides]